MINYLMCGEIVIVILFALMLTKIEDFREIRDQTHRPIAFLASACIFILLTASILLTEVRTTQASEISIEKIGEVLFNQWAIPFEVASIILLVALIGAIVMVRVGQTNDCFDSFSASECCIVLNWNLWGFSEA